MDGAYLTYANRKIDAVDFDAAIRALADDGRWTPALWKMRQSLAELTGMHLPRYEDRISRGRGVTRDPNAIDTELFFVEPRRLVYIVNSPATALAVPGGFDGRRQLERTLGLSFETTAPRGARGVLVGAVGADSSSLKELAEQLCADFEHALRNSIDGRRARHIQFEWSANPSGSAIRRRKPLAHLVEADEELGLRFSSPEGLDEETLAKVQVLTDPIARTIMREIAESNFARHADLLTRRGKRQDEYEAAVSRVKAVGLVESEYLLQCKKTSAQLVRVKDVAELSTPSISNFRCASCNRPFADELVSEGYGVSDSGRHLTRGSHWMTIWVTQQLLELGVAVERILWNVEDSGEEVDIILDHVDRTWIFELKDREFGAGDAYPFNYRKARYEADEAVVVTTDKVAPDARRVFDDLAGSRKPHLVEGLGNFATVLEECFNRAGSVAARNALVVPSATSGFELRTWYESNQGTKTIDVVQRRAG